MAVGGTVSTPILVYPDGQFLTFTVSSAAVTLGDVVMLSASDGTVLGATTGSVLVIGVVINGNRISRTATDDQVPVGAVATVCTRGVVYCSVGTGTVTVGDLVEAYTTGTVHTHTAGAAAYPAVLGKALTTSTTSVQVMLGLI